MERPNPRHRVLVCTFLFQNGSVLLGRKQTGPGAGVLNGFGGEVEYGETPEGAARREFQEKAGGVEVLGLIPYGELGFSFEETSLTYTVHIFRATSHIGIPRNTPEMHIAWYPIARMPFDTMWDGDRHWFPLLAVGTSFRGRIHYDNPETRKIISHTVRALEAVASG